MFIFVSKHITVSVEQCCKLWTKKFTGTKRKEKKKTAEHATCCFSCLDRLACSPNKRALTLEVISSYACVWADGVNMNSQTASEREKERDRVWVL